MRTTKAAPQVMREVRDRLQRSVLFVPGSRADRFDKAVTSGADIVCLDLEDGVQPSDKIQARTKVLEYVAGNRPDCQIAVRINSPRTRVGLQDILALIEATRYPNFVMLPKVESQAELEWVSGLLGESRHAPPVIPLVETLKGLARVDEIAAATCTAIIGLGTGDLAADMGVTMDWEPMLLARQQLVQAAKRAEVAAMDGAWLQVDDLEGLANEVRRSAALGFTVKPCLHPRQVETVHAAFTPADEIVQAARELVAAFEAAGTGVFLFKGRMVDLPVVEQARRQVALWESGRPS